MSCFKMQTDKSKLDTARKAQTRKTQSEQQGRTRLDRCCELHPFVMLVEFGQLVCLRFNFFSYGLSADEDLNCYPLKQFH